MSNSFINKISAALICLLLFETTRAQTDSSKMLPLKADTLPQKVVVDSLPVVATPVQNMSRIDSMMKYHSPKKAALRSALIPGWGQIYNKRYWKVPIVYGALGVTASVFVYNLGTYQDLRLAVQGKTEAMPPTKDSTKYKQIKPEYVNIDINALRSYRDEFRRNIDYTIIVFILLWGLQVVDASVDAHLKAFDVSPDLSFKIRMGKSHMAGTTGLSLVMSIK